MSISDASELQDVLASVRSWSPERRLTLAEELLRTLYPALRPDGLRGVSADQVRGIATGDGPPPNDDTVKQWIHERRTEKYG